MIWPTCHDGNHIFTWTTGSANPDELYSTYCHCGQAWYDQDTKQATMIFNGYNPYSSRTKPTEPANAIPIANFKAAQQINDATHISADGARVFTNDGERVYYWDEESKRYGSSFPCPEGLPADAVLLDKE